MLQPQLQGMFFSQLNNPGPQISILFLEHSKLELSISDFLAGLVQFLPRLHLKVMEVI